MKLLSKNIVIPRTSQEANAILKQAAHYHPVATFSSDGFSMHCAKRTMRGGFSLTPVKGTYVSTSNGIEVRIAVHAGLGIYIGAVIIVLGLLAMLVCVVTLSSRWVPCLGLIAIGAIAFGCDFWDSVVCLRHLERILYQ